MRIDLKYLFFLLIIYIFYLIQGGVIFTSLLVIFLSMGAISLLMTVMSLLKLKSTLKVKKKLYTTGDRGEFFLSVANDSLFFIPFLRAFNGQEEMEVRSLSAKDETHIPLRYDFYRRGVYEFKDITLEIKDAFNIISLRRVFKREIIRVYPKLVPIKHKGFSPGFGSLGERRNLFSNEDPYHQKELKLYTPGDSLKKVNWKVSAKYGEIFVKIGESTRGKNFLIILDMSDRIYRLDKEGVHEEAMVSYALSVSKDILKKGYEQTFVLNGMEARSFEINTIKDFNNLIEYTVDNDSRGDRDIAEFISDWNGSNRDKGGILVFTANLSPEAKDSIREMKTKSNSVSVFTFDVENNLDLAEGGISLYAIEGEF